MNKPILSSKTFLAYSLGCRVNQAEIESLTRQLISHGFGLSKNNCPDFILLNTCVVTSKAERETRKEMRRLKKTFPQSYLVVLGCAPSAKEKLTFKLPQADLFVPNEEKQRVTSLLEEKFSPKPSKENPPVKSPYILSGRKFIKIQEGCNLFCSFCLTAHLRGKPQSVPPAQVVNEINDWVKEGVKEIILTGINLSLYGQDIETNLAALFKAILKETPVERITLSSIYPQMLTPDFLEVIVGNPRITQAFHLSIQSGSSSVLQRMNRKTDINELTNYLLIIKKKNPQFTFRADIITGFPGETEKEFQETINFIKKNKISFVHVFPYSKRKGTTAYLLPDLPVEIKKERVKKVQQTALKVRENEAVKLINKETSCLIVRRVKVAWEGLADNGWPILLRFKIQDSRFKNLKGEIVPVKITAFQNDQLFGEILSLPK